MQDSYLDSFKEQSHIDDATAFIESFYADVTDASNKAYLIEIKTYMNVALENQNGQENDLFESKFQTYKELFSEAIKHSRDAIKAESGISNLVIPLERA